MAANNILPVESFDILALKKIVDGEIGFKVFHVPPELVVIYILESLQTITVEPVALHDIFVQFLFVPLGIFCCIQFVPELSERYTKPSL